MKKQKYLICVMMILSIFISTGMVFSAELGLDEILEKGLEKNLELEIARYELENARLDYRKSELDNLMSQSRLIKLQGELKYLQAAEEYKTINNQVILDITGQYLNLIKLTNEIGVKEKEVELKEKRLQETKAQVEVGYESPLEYFSDQNEYQTLVNELEKVRDDRQQLLKELKNKIGAAAEMNIELVSLQEPEIWDITEEEAVEKAISNSQTLLIKEKSVGLAEAELARAKIVSTPELDLNKLENNLTIARLGYKLEEQNIETSLQKQYYLYKQAVKNLDTAARGVKQARDNHQIIKEQQSAGLVTENDLLEAEVSLLESRNDRLLAIINYYTNKIKLENQMGLEIEVKINEKTQKD